MRAADVKVGRLLYPERVERPSTRGDCVEGMRPCPYVSCRYNLYLDVMPSGEIRLNYPAHVEPWDVPAHMSCALDLAERGGLTLEEVGSVIGVTRERVRQIEGNARIRVVPELSAELTSHRIFPDLGW